MRRLGLALLPAVATVALLAGCGDTAEKNRYIDRINGAQKALNAQVQALQGEASSDPARAFSKIGREFAHTADELSAIEPPDEVKGEHRDLVAAVRGFGDALGNARKGLVSRRRGESTRALTDLGAAADKFESTLTTTIDRINRKLHS